MIMRRINFPRFILSINQIL